MADVDDDADSQDLATQMAKACNPYFFHLPLFDDVELPSYGFPGRNDLLIEQPG